MKARNKNLISTVFQAVLATVISVSLGAGIAYGAGEPVLVRNLAALSATNSSNIRLDYCFQANPDIDYVVIRWTYGGVTQDYNPPNDFGSSSYPMGCSSTKHVIQSFELNDVGSAQDGKYIIQVVAYNDGSPTATTPRSFYYDTKAPTKPNLSADANNGSVALSWSKSTDSLFKSYQLYRGSKLIKTTTSRSFTDNLANNASYSHTYKVVAVDKAGNKSSDTAGASFTYNPPAVSQDTNNESPNEDEIVPVSAPAKKPVEQKPVKEEAKAQKKSDPEVKGRIEEAFKPNSLVLALAGGVTGLGLIGLVLFIVLKQRHKTNEIIFETLSPKTEPIASAPDDNPITQEKVQD